MFVDACMCVERHATFVLAVVDRVWGDAVVVMDSSVGEASSLYNGNTVVDEQYSQDPCLESLGSQGPWDILLTDKQTSTPASFYHGLSFP